jgi:hypothetical protein
VTFFHCFPQSPQANSRILPQLVHVLLPDHFQVIVYLAALLTCKMAFRCIRGQFKRGISIFHYKIHMDVYVDCLCGLVDRVSGYRSRGLGSIPALPDFLRSSGSGTGSTQPREYN